MTLSFGVHIACPVPAAAAAFISMSAAVAGGFGDGDMLHASPRLSQAGGHMTYHHVRIKSASAHVS